jgi:hypothetical protein
MNRFVENASAFTDALGVRQAPLVVWLSMVPWEGEDRDSFIRSLTGRRLDNGATRQTD